MDKVTDYIMEIPSGMSHDECNTIETYYRNTATWDDSYFANAKRKLTNTESKEKVVMKDQWIYKGGKYYDQLKEGFNHAGREYTKIHNKINILGMSPFRINWYKKGGFMVNHIDNIHHSHGQQWGYPHITILLFLNDEYEGGELSLCDGEYEMKGKRGSFIVFPSNFMYPHEVKKVTEGERFTVMVWIA